MRFLEDKLIEPEAMVERLGENGTAWADFNAESRRLDRIYNGIIFKHHTIIDDASFVVDERVFAGVRERLAHTNTSYNFNYIPIHVLGSIYERFLCKVIVATDKRARVEEKPEVRKASGVYYTPEYIDQGDLYVRRMRKIAQQRRVGWSAELASRRRNATTTSLATRKPASAHLGR